MSSPPGPSGPCNDTSLLGIINCGAGTATQSSGATASSLISAIVASLASFGIQIGIFMLLRLKLSRIYRPRSYLVPEKDRVAPPPKGLFSWLVPLFTTPNLSFIQKCGLDAYFFLRYLRLLLKIFVPAAVIVLPILLPINNYSGHNKGLDRLSISNVDKEHTKNRLWAHLALALVFISWVLYVIYRELRGYIRVRQAYLTSPQHRIRASATTVLVQGIPRKWLTLEALNGLYDVFPGGIRNIWINRNFDELGSKVAYRDSLAISLEGAETNLIKMCRKKHEKAEYVRRKKDGRHRKTKLQRRKDDDAAAEQMAQGQGISAGDQHDTPHGLQEALHDAEEAERRRDEHEHLKEKPTDAFGIIGHGFGALGEGLANIGKGVTNAGRNVVGDVGTGLHKAVNNVDTTVDRVNDGNGFVTDDELYRRSMIGDGVPPTPPPKSPIAGRHTNLQNNQTDGATFSDSRRRPVERNGLAIPAPVPSDGAYGTPTSDTTQGPPTIRTTGPSTESRPRAPLEIEVPASHTAARKKWKIWKNTDRSIALPSPQPHTSEEDEFPLNSSAKRANAAPDLNEKPDQQVSGSKWTEKVMFWKKSQEDVLPKEEYPTAINSEWDEDQDGEPYWRRYLEPKERETMRVPLLSPTWCPSLPLIGKKVDRIYWLRRELARMNLEIEIDQNDVERYPFMNSAFIQFNHQVAAHMACQAVSHHVPKHMAPRLVEISPDDVLWNNMSIKWWERYLRTGIVLAICAALIILYAVPVTFTSLLSKVSTLANFKALAWLNNLPQAVIGIVQGVLPPAILAIILALVPIIFRMLVMLQGVPTGNAQEIGVQQWYFAFLFIQVFLVVTITGGIFAFFTQFAVHPNQVLSTLANNLPKASNYFFNYLMVQALSNSASAILQVGALAVWFLLAPILDSTARAKWTRQTTLANVQWGTFFPPFTNFAVIGIIYSIIAPLILVFMIIIFALFWIVYRYNVLYVYQFRNDTGGLLFPTAVNQLFVGLYVMELCLVGLFFIATDVAGNVVCFPQAIIMIVALLFTVLFQWLLNSAFKPLFQYLPITLEDEAVMRDEEFARAQAGKFAPLRHGDGAEDERDIQDVLEEREQREEDADDKAEEQERRDIEERRRSQRDSSLHGTATTRRTDNSRPDSYHRSPGDANRQSWKDDRWRRAPTFAARKLTHLARAEQNNEKPVADPKTANVQTTRAQQDVEAQKTVGDVLFSGFADELEDLTPEERDVLVRYAFQHRALRAKRPVVWIPRDRLGVSDDEIRRAKRMSTVRLEDNEKGGVVEKTNIWMSNEGVALNGKGKVVFRRSPPDFSNVDLIVL